MDMKIVAYLDNDELNKPSTGTLEVYALSSGNNLYRNTLRFLLRE